MQYKLSEEDYVHGGTQKSVYSPEEVEAIHCPLCDSDKFTPVYKERGSIGVVECNGCGLLYTNPRVKDAEQNYFGDPEVFLDEARLVFTGKKPHHRDRNYQYELDHIKRFKPSGRFLDIGTNMGFFLRKAKAMGYDTEGVEPSPALANIAEQKFALKIKNNFFKKEDFASASFDIITMIDVFEHVANPCQLLDSAHAVLKSDGILCIKVPNGNYGKLKLRIAKTMGREAQHDIFNSYEHVVHYTPRSMKEMLRRNGFTIKKLIVPLPIHPPIWANLVGHYYQYPSPFILDYKRIIARNFFYYTGKIENALGMNTHFAPDLMFIIEKAR